MPDLTQYMWIGWLALAVIFIIIALQLVMLVIVKLNCDIFFGYYDLRYCPSVKVR